jgi:hypothetical protein
MVFRVRVSLASGDERIRPTLVVGEEDLAITAKMAKVARLTVLEVAEVAMRLAEQMEQVTIVVAHATVTVVRSSTVI